MANERYSSRLISEGTAGYGTFGSLSGALVAAIVLTVAGILLVWVLFFLLSSA
jgi:hypothetical protein